jgi:hypothetical protein
MATILGWPTSLDGSAVPTGLGMHGIVSMLVIATVSAM